MTAILVVGKQKMQFNFQDVGQSKAQSLLNLQVVRKPKPILEDSTLKMESFIGMI